MKKNYRPFLIVLLILVCSAIVFFGYQLFDKTSDYRAGKKFYRSVSESYAPQDEMHLPKTLDASEPTAPEREQGNPTVAQLCADYPDAIGWLTVPNTRIDYPLVCSKDNSDFRHL